MTLLLYASDKIAPTTMATSSYQAVRVILIVEYSRINNSVIVKAEAIALTTIMGVFNVAGLVKSGSTPVGGIADGMSSRPRPGDMARSMSKDLGS